MSMILDALNRARHGDDPVPGLETQHEAPRPTLSVARYLPWVALACALIAIAWLLWRGEATAPPAAPLVAAVEGSVEGPVPEPQPRMVDPTAADSIPADPTPASVATATADVRDMNSAQAQAGDVPVSVATPKVTSVVTTARGQQQAERREADSVPIPYTSNESQPNGAAPDAEVVQLYAEPVVKEAPVKTSKKAVASTVSAKPKKPGNAKVALGSKTREEALDVEELLARARAGMAEKKLSQHAAPLLADLSQQIKDQVPTLLYQRHDYIQQGGRSEVVINGKKLGVGGSPAAGVKIEEILSDSIVLRHRDNQFRLRALNSWVNL